METASLKLVKKNGRWFSYDMPVVIRMMATKLVLRTSGPVQAHIRVDNYNEYVVTFDGASGVISNVKHYNDQAGTTEPDVMEIPLDSDFVQMVHVTKDVAHEG